MDEIQLVEIAETAWLKFLGDEFASIGEKYIFEYPTKTFADGSVFNPDTDFYVIPPAFRHREQVDTGAVEMEFQILVATGQKPGEVLTAHRKNRELRASVEAILFGSDREAVGVGSGVYTIPLAVYDEDGNSEGVLPDYELYYRKGEWTNQTPDGARSRLWVMNVSAQITP